MPLYTKEELQKVLKEFINNKDLDIYNKFIIYIHEEYNNKMRQTMKIENLKTFIDDIFFYNLNLPIIKFFEKNELGYLLTEKREKIFLELLAKNINDIGETEKRLIYLINKEYVK